MWLRSKVYLALRAVSLAWGPWHAYTLTTMRKIDGVPRVTFSLRVPAEHAEAVAEYARTLTRTTRLNVTPSAAGAAILEAGLVALGLIETSARAPHAPKKGAKPPRKA
jgi:hypothetical protein